MRTSTIRIHLLTLVVALRGGTSAWAQSDPVLVGSSSATSTSLVSSLTLTAPDAFYPGDIMLTNLSQSYSTGPVTVSLSSVANVAALSNQGTNPSNGGVDTSGYAFDANTALNTPVFGTACAAGSFGYVGQSFSYTVAPVITVTAVALGGATTQNYTGSLMRLTNSSLTGRTYTPTPASPALTLTGLPATASDPAIADLGTGQSTLTFSAGSGISYARGTASSPFSANIALSINVVDLDGATASNPVTFGAGSGIAFSTGARQYYGRLLLGNAVGSELLDLPMPLTTQYYLSATQGFVTNTSNVCTTAPALTFGNYLLNLQANKTCVRDSGKPGVSGQGCATAASSRYSPTASAGAFNLILAAPGAGNSGALTVTATAPTWLQYLWNVSSGSNSSPSGVATFMHRLMIDELAQAGTEASRARVRTMNLDLVQFYRQQLRDDAGRQLVPTDPLFLHLTVLGASDFVSCADALIRERLPAGTDMD